MIMQQVADAQAAVTAATAGGKLTVASNTPFYPGALAWVSGTDNVSYRVRIVALVGATDMLVRQEHNNNELKGPPNYGLTSMSALALPGVIFQEAQLVRFFISGGAKLPVP